MTYVNITRQELEAWLTQNFRAWERTNTAGVYLIPLSERVAVKLSSTQSQQNMSMGRGQASMNLTLVSRINGHVLNRKSRDRKHFQRTTNWRTTWKKGVDHWLKVYLESKDFYDKIADRQAYQDKWLALIDSIPSSGSNPKLFEMRDAVVGGDILWNGQERYILDLIKENKEREERLEKETRQPLSVDTLRDMYRAARSLHDREAMENITRLGLNAKEGALPSREDLNLYKRYYLTFLM